MKRRLPGSIGLLAAIAFGAAACSITTDENGPPPPSSSVVVDPTDPTSTLVVRWTIDGAVDPNGCILRGVAKIEISIIDPNDVEFGAFQQTCVTFATSISLPPGDYSAFAVLLDGDDRVLTTDAPIAPFTLFDNDELTIAVDFPTDSFR